MVVTSGEVITATGEEKQGTSESAATAGLTTGEKYIKMQLANADEKHNLIYIDVKDLVDEYTAEWNFYLKDIRYDIHNSKHLDCNASNSLFVGNIYSK